MRSSIVRYGSTSSSCARPTRKKKAKRPGERCSKSASGLFRLRSHLNTLTKAPFARYSCQELLAEMVHTKDGSLCVREFLAWGSAKDRKQIIKVLKPHLERIWTNEEGQLVLFTALDVVECAS